MDIAAWAAPKAKRALEPFRYAAAALGPSDVHIQITHCGICHSDLHLINDDWGNTPYPLVPGHEIIGQVIQVGSAVSHLRPGMRVGVGWQRSACGECEDCRRGDDNLCPRSQATCRGHHGGFADAIVADSRFAFSIPEPLSSAQAAPLLCAGVTVFSPLRRHQVGPGARVGILGIGGLGHLALQFAKALGAEVTALSSTRGKEADARRFGAHAFLGTTEKGALQGARRSLDFILCTVNVDLAWSDYMALLRPYGKLCFVGVPPAPLGLNAGAFISGQKSVTGSAIGGRAMMADMLAFAADHGIAAQIEAAPMDQVNAALSKVAANAARYRMVLQNP